MPSGSVFDLIFFILLTFFPFVKWGDIREIRMVLRTLLLKKYGLQYEKHIDVEVFV